ncbi:DUF2807 domain-containing protein [Sphingomonas donggukensis]|uniref:DUF2807 domain-containing protein n=1 Tax=Sphingomonas donggukensis TaxID=2949093 RepID=A0ABY4TWU8_9SPHN|nr:head GIN domain-containing protein [Sphingomonas donggukensis]URW75634.1 DUF2807 domain-containing protein [Sphingomonas donggukensis]
MMRSLWVLAALPLVACGTIDEAKGEKVAGTGAGSSRTFQVADFTGVELAGFDDVDVTVGPAFSVRADGRSEDLDKLDIRKDGSTLHVGRRKGDGWGWGKDGKGVTVRVTMPAIALASLAGSGNLKVDKVSGGDFRGELAGSGDLSVGQLAANSAKLDIAGSGGIRAAGQVRALSVSIAGSGDVDAKGLRADSADISIAGSGNVTADVTGDASIDLMGSGDVTLGQGARCKINKMGSGEVRCG